MEELTKQYKALRVAVEKTVGRKMCTPRDFAFLATSIHEATNETISTTTQNAFGAISTSRRYILLSSSLSTRFRCMWDIKIGKHLWLNQMRTRGLKVLQ